LLKRFQFRTFFSPGRQGFEKQKPRGFDEQPAVKRSGIRPFLKRISPFGFETGWKIFSSRGAAKKKFRQKISFRVFRRSVSRGRVDFAANFASPPGGASSSPTFPAGDASAASVFFFGRPRD
jgi:hypothetical protein